MKHIVKIILAVLLLLCLADMPYGYYNLIRFISTFVFAYYACEYYKANKNVHGIVFLALAILFQPFMKFTLGREMWNMVDVVVAIGLIYLAFHERKNKLL